MARAAFVKKARKDNKEYGIKKGDSYWWWKFRFGGKHYSKTPPKQSQLTQSEFLSTIWGIEESFADLKAEDGIDSIKGDVENWIDEIRSLGEEQSDKRSNMPDALQDSETGTLLEDRETACNEMAEELEAIDLEDGDLKDIVEQIQAVSYGGE